MQVLNETNFEKEIKKNKFIAIDFFAEWCGPCRYLAPIFEGLEKDFEGRMKLAKIDTEMSPALAEEFEVRSIPCIIVFKEGHEEQRIVGMMEASELKARLNDVLKRK